ncbi:glycoside hydrolase family 95 protein [uncultured Gemmiger sp.]|uniref:glycoside hydrolase family 95 protein n=1 Tax=uncultured Gemmiger sp. TaxID=1623490 RepID=UPI0025DF0A64|nr:glycoside hydrolase family 95 protein [uncultured Gemmiger sp.]
MELWYRQPARVWEEALPCGNGRLGCMVFGHPTEERVQLNEESVWSGPPMDRLNPDSKAALPQVRRLLREGHVHQAEQLALQALSGTPENARAYQTLGDWFLDFADLEEPVEQYRRALDLDRGVQTVSFVSGGTAYTREIFCSAPDNVIALRLKAEGEGRLHFRCRLTRPAGLDKVGRDKAAIWMEGSTGNGAVTYCAMLTAAECDGRVGVTGEFLTVEDAATAVLYLTAATGFRTPDPRAACAGTLAGVREKGFGKVEADHIADYRKFYDTMHLHLGDGSRDAIPTDERRQACADGACDPGLEALYFAYGRYLLLCSSRPGSLPANLQGIWNEELTPPWGARFTININIEMNYWPAGPCGLGPCEQPLFDLLARLDADDTGRRMAREMYGCRGFVAHHNTDLYADAAPQDQYIPASYWVMGAAWACTHIWRHYAYTRDRAMLERYYFILEDSARFFADFLETDEEGYAVTNPSVSPENTYILPDGTHGCMCIGPTMDNQILRDLFDGFLKASRTLGRDNDLTRQIAGLRDRLRPTQIGPDGRLLEWRRPWDEAEPGHRHISHLYGLYPGQEITPDTPDTFAAARKTLETRLSYGGGHTGWSRAWIIGLWARLRDGEKAHENLQVLLKNSTFPNLMDSHPRRDGATFQIDGNFGATAAMAEMLVYSAEDKAVLLPALPAAWADGRVDGLRLRGNAGLSMTWQAGTLQQAVLTADSPLHLTLCCRDKTRTVELAAGQTLRLNGELETL